MRIKMYNYETNEIIFEGSENELLEINDYDVYLMEKLNELRNPNTKFVLVVVGNFADFYKIYKVD